MWTTFLYLSDVTGTKEETEGRTLLARRSDDLGGTEHDFVVGCIFSCVLARNDVSRTEL